MQVNNETAPNGITGSREFLVGMTMLFSTALFIYEMEGVGLELGSLAMLVYLVGVNLIQFYIDQFSTVTKALIQFLLL